MSTPTLLLVHGAWHGSWAWDLLLREPALADVPIVTVDLPGLHRAAGARHDLAAHSTFLTAAVTDIGGPVVICSHSYGGAVVSDGAGGLDNVVANVFVAAFMLEGGESCRDANTAATDPGPRPHLEGDYLVVADDVAPQMFYGDAEPAAAAAAAARLTPEHVGTVSSPVRTTAWRSRPSWFVLTDRDQAFPVTAQRALARRADRQILLPTDHSPMLSRPELLASVLAEVVAGR